MSPLGLELLTMFWPGISAALLGGATYFWRQQATRLDGISKALEQFRGEVRADIDRIERDFSQHRTDITHKLDIVIGKTHARLVEIETVCEHQHGVNLRRRRTDAGGDWAQTSDVMGASGK